jgi:hypothetical protein
MKQGDKPSAIGQVKRKKELEAEMNELLAKYPKLS